MGQQGYVAPTALHQVHDQQPKPPGADLYTVDGPVARQPTWLACPCASDGRQQSQIRQTAPDLSPNQMSPEDRGEGGGGYRHINGFDPVLCCAYFLDLVQQLL